MLFMDSFDHYLSTGGTATNPNGFEQKWDIGATVPTANTSGRTGSCAKFSGSESLSKIVIGSPSNSVQYITGFALKSASGGHSGNQEFMSYRDGTTRQLSLCMTSTYKLQLRTGSGAATLLSETNNTIDFVGGYHYIEMGAVIHNTSGSFELRVDGAAVPMTTANPLSSANTGTSTGMSHVEFGMAGDMQALFFDDLYILDNTVVTNSVTNTFLGDVKVVCTFPILDGNHEQWTKSADSGIGANNSSVLVDDPPSSSPCPDGDATYISSTTNTQRSSFIFDDILTIGDPKAVQATTSMRTDTNSRTGAVFARISALDFDGAGMSIGASSYSMLNSPGTTDGRRKVWNVNPNGNVAWTLTVLNNAEFGVLVIS
jgi:hypothetical protein